MKNLNDFQEEKKEQSKKEGKLKKDEGADDKKYMALMVEYKKARRGRDKDAANRLLKKVMDLGRNGDVSEKAKVGAAYL